MSFHVCIQKIQELGQIICHSALRLQVKEHVQEFQMNTWREKKWKKNAGRFRTKELAETTFCLPGDVASLLPLLFWGPWVCFLITWYLVCYLLTALLIAGLSRTLGFTDILHVLLWYLPQWKWDWIYCETTLATLTLVIYFYSRIILLVLYTTSHF